MERGPFLNDEVRKEFERFVVIILHTDGTDERHLDSSIRNQDLKRERFGTAANPHYAVLDPTGKKVYWEKGGVFGVEELLAGLRTVPSQ